MLRSTCFALNGKMFTYIIIIIIGIAKIVFTLEGGVQMGESCWKKMQWNGCFDVNWRIVDIF